MIWHRNFWGRCGNILVSNLAITLTRDIPIMDLTCNDDGGVRRTGVVDKTRRRRRRRRRRGVGGTTN